MPVPHMTIRDIAMTNLGPDWPTTRSNISDPGHTHGSLPHNLRREITLCLEAAITEVMQILILKRHAEWLNGGTDAKEW